MALWGNKDTKAVTGTVDVTQNSAAVAGTDTAFTTELKPGQSLVIASVEYKILSIASDTSLTLATVYAGTTATELTITANEQPAYVPAADLDEVFGVDAAEAAVAGNKAKGINTPGWVQYRTYTDSAGATRHKAETLVAMGTISGDAADDSTVADS